MNHLQQIPNIPFKNEYDTKSNKWQSQKTQDTNSKVIIIKNLIIIQKTAKWKPSNTLIPDTLFL